VETLTIILVVIVVVVATSLAVVVEWWFDAYKDDDYIHKNDKVFNDFYTLIKEKDDV